MTWTPATFVAAWPEFASTLAADTAMGRTVVQSALTAAASECDPRLYPDDIDHLVGLLAAHKLAVSPFGQQARVDTGDKKKADETTIYLREFNRLTSLRAGGPWTVGQPAVSPAMLPSPLTGFYGPWGWP